ncbi:rhamnogalacturonan lyase [Nocardiopsis sp. HUAS JQ3]|uniref:rhamnogalacturonan lyase n=1 Tax=Nocardiopsis sp. HUAS JQ3 TaxID=3061629 RepID=UPI0023A95CC2|nr:rhamnogalacturonan lyase [Nocardiopsis sp. HUAS JQ3]WDZ89605.1 rhamnogalacturonan lyase [Nocardiopsis sp. HUAS JQ3]
MGIPPRSVRRTSPLLAGVCALVMAGSSTALAEPGGGSGIQLERLDRGLVAVGTPEGVFLSWRLLASEVGGHTDTGLRGPQFRVYRDGRVVAMVRDSTNFLDEEGSADSEYRVVPVPRGRPGVGPEGEAAVWAEGHHDLPLQRPEGGATPAGEEYGYTANDVSVGDVDGDGRYEFVVKWDPTNSKDVSQRGYTGPTYVDTYTLDGELLHRIDLGVNIRSGAHYTQFVVYDLDGNGRSEIMLKTAPGTRTLTFDGAGEASGEHITLPEEDVEAGVGHGDDYRMSAEDYREHVVAVFRGWHEHPEVVAGNWPATLEEAFGGEPRYDYPLSEADAGALADLFLDEYAPSRSARNELREFEGFVVDGPEYLTVFDGETGAELDTVRYEPGRGDDGLMWGDYAMARIEPGNRVDRLLSGVAYLDGTRPSAVFARGYYTRSAVAAYDFDGEDISTRWIADSGHVPMDNPFDASPHGGRGSDPDTGTLAGQGFHSFGVADVDADGRQEIVYGSATLDDDGSLLYSSHAEGPPGSAIEGQTTKLGHGDAMHVGDLDPEREGLEVWTVHEGGASAPYGFAMRDAATGEVLFGGYTGTDTGRGMVGDVDPDVPGLEAWSSMPPGGGTEAGLWSADGEFLGDRTPGTNMSIRWSADMTTQIVEGTEDSRIEDWRRGTLLTAEGTLTNNGTKGNPALVADVLGDWREELVLRTEDSGALRILTSTEVTGHRLHTLMHDPQYRVDVARQQTGYNQPAYPSFHLGADTDWARVEVPDAVYPE